jgi:hypothetical protein
MRSSRIAVAALACTALLAVAGCARPGTHAGSGAQPAGGVGALSSVTSSPSAVPKPTVSASSTACGSWGCTQKQRLVAAGNYIDSHVTGSNGYLSVVFTDRQAGNVWAYGPTEHEGWTASTIKLAIATDLLNRQRAGSISLTSSDQHDMATMLDFSDENASDRLWSKFGGDAQLARFRDQFGMTGLHFVPGFTSNTYWGFVKCTTRDLASLMNYIFTETNAADRGYLVGAMRGVASNQQWGVWAAGSGQQPGNKDGWSDETDSYGKHWVTNTVGFAGPDERYLVAVMYQVDPSGSLAGGVHTVSDVVALLFGVAVPAQITVPAPDG